MDYDAEILEEHRFDQRKLSGYLQDKLPGFSGNLAVRQFQGGQSNPTFLLIADDRRYVLRKKPIGTLLPSAHAVDREFAVLHALEATHIPVPKVHLLCSDETVIGEIFYVMDYIGGRIFDAPSIGGAEFVQRRPIAIDLAHVLADLHTIEVASLGLASFGAGPGYIRRQVARWTRQYRATGFDVPAMDALMDWLPEHIPSVDECALTHGDYRVGNVIVDPIKPRIIAVLDWELATIGHPLADLAYCCLPYRLPSTISRGFSDLTPSNLGLPTEAEFIEAYCTRAGRKDLDHFEFFVTFSLFRAAAIIAGVHRRALDGNAATRDALEKSEDYGVIADIAWRTAVAQR